MVARKPHTLTEHVTAMATHRSHHRHAHQEQTSQLLAEADAQTRKEGPRDAGGSPTGHGQR